MKAGWQRSTSIELSEFLSHGTNANCLTANIIKAFSHRNMKKQNHQQSAVLLYLGMVTHFVLQFCVVMAFSSSSSWPVFFSFFTKLFTAFSHHFSSCPFCSAPPAPPGLLVDFFQPKSLFTTGGVNGNMEDILSWTSQESPQDLIQVFSHTQTRGDWELQFRVLALRSPSTDHWVTGWTPPLAV